MTASLAAAALLAGCAKVTTDSPEITTDSMIDFDLGYVATKGQISTQEFLTNGTSVQVYDYLSFPKASEEETYLNDEVVYNSSESKWKLKSGKQYAWTRSGTHKFFGWITKDAKGNLTPANLWSSPTISYSGKVLTLPSKSLDFTSTAQVDFLYSDIVSRTMSNSTLDDHSPVQLKMKHVFSAVSFGLNNQLQEDITLKSIKLQGIHNTGSATVDFTGVSTQLNYSTFTGALGREWSDATGVVLKAKTRKPDAFNLSSSARDVRMMWPLTWDKDLYPGVMGTAWGYDADGNLINNTTSPLIYVRYILKGKEHYVPVALTEGLDWTPGVNVHYDIIFTERQIIVTATVNPWDYNEQNIDYESEIVSIVKGLEADQSYGHCTVSGTTVTFTDGLHVRSTFALSTPVGGSWMVELSGKDSDAFELYAKTDQDPVSIVSGTVGSVAEFYIRPKKLLSNGKYETKVKVTVKTASGRFVNADNVVQEGTHNLTYTYIKQ